MTCSINILSSSPEDTQQVGRAIGQAAQPGDICLLTGPLGAGKTCLTQGIAQGLEVEGYVRSPTFVLMTQYRGRLTLNHLDLYRISGAVEAWDLGLDEQLFGDGLSVVEWADRAPELFPPDCLSISLDHAGGEDQRMIKFLDAPARYREVLQRLADALPGAAEVNP